MLRGQRSRLGCAGLPILASGQCVGSESLLKTATSLRAKDISAFLKTNWPDPLYAIHHNCAVGLHRLVRRLRRRRSVAPSFDRRRRGSAGSNSSPFSHANTIPYANSFTSGRRKCRC